MTPPIVQAALRCDRPTFEALLAQGADVQTVTAADGWNLLHCALMPLTRPADPSFVSRLLQCGVPVRARDRLGNTPLHFAARAHDLASMGLLLDAGAEIDAEDANGLTPLRVLLTRPPVPRPAVAMLLERGADMHRAPPGGISSRAYLAASGSPDEADLQALFDRFDPTLRRH